MRKACQSEGSIFLMFQFIKMIKIDDPSQKFFGEDQQYLLKNCSQIRKLISGMVAWGI